MSDYPDAIYDPRAKENDPGTIYNPANKTIIFAEDIVKLDDEVIAIETELGFNPKGEYADVATRLAAQEGGFQSRVRAYLSTSLYVPANTEELYILDTKKFDGLNEFDAVSTFKFTPTQAGYYFVSASANFEALTGTDYSIRIYKNKVMNIFAQTSGMSESGQVAIAHATGIIHLSVGDFIRCFLFHNDSAPVKITNDPSFSCLCIHRLS